MRAGELVMPIKVWDYLKDYESEKDEILSAVEKVFSSGWLILGESVKAFEKAFAEYCQMKYGIGVDNATNAATLALRGLGIREGDEVITVPNTAVPTVSAIVTAGATPVFVDVDSDTLLMDTNALEEAITGKTRAIIPVHLYGQCVDMDPVMSLSKKHGIAIVEDVAQAHGAEYSGRKAGSMSDYSTFSFYPTKPLGTYGDGGMVLTNSEELDKKMRRLRFYGMETTYYAEEHGYNSRLDEVHAEILLRKLKRLDAQNDKRIALANRYRELLCDSALILPVTLESNKHVYYVYGVRHRQREQIMEELKKRGILLNISYKWPIHIMRGYSYLGYRAGDFPVAEKAANEIFSLPMYPGLTFEEQDQVCLALTEILGKIHT